MTLLFITLPAALVIAAGAVAAFMWAARNDQYEDLDTPPRRMLLEDPRSAPRGSDPASAGTHPGGSAVRWQDSRPPAAPRGGSV